MPYETYFNMLLNIGLLVLIAALLTNLEFVRDLFLEEQGSLFSKTVLAVIFGVISIVSTYTGTRTDGAIINTRVIGVLAAGLLGGPYVGMLAALIAGMHRYLFDIGGFTAVSCAVSTLFEGILGSMFSARFKSGKMRQIGIFALTAVAEVAQMAIILLISRPFSDALHLVRRIAVPMILMNSCGMLIFLKTFDMIFIREEGQFAEKMRLCIGIVEQSLPHLRKGLQSREDMEAAAQIIYRSISCSAVMITDMEQVLAVQTKKYGKELADPAFLVPVLESVVDLKPTYFQQSDFPKGLGKALKDQIIVTAPLLENEHPVGGMTIMIRKRRHAVRVDLEFVEELTRLFSTQLELSNLEYQKKLRRQAELKALQSQVNPHFLYNALNTISYICRENAERARELLLTLASYYRQTLENEQYMLNLHTELYHVNTYLELEKARFEEKLQVDMEIEEDLDCMVPSFILQPLVENAVRYGADEAGIRTVLIRAFYALDGREKEQKQVCIQVQDHGKGFPQEVLEQFYDGDNGNRVGLKNVHERLKSVYGSDHGLRIENTGRGACVSFCIPQTPVHPDNRCLQE